MSAYLLVYKAPGDYGNPPDFEFLSSKRDATSRLRWLRDECAIEDVVILKTETVARKRGGRKEGGPST